MVSEILQLPEYGFSLTLFLLVFLPPFVSLFANKKFLGFILGMKYMAAVYIFVLFVAFLIARGIFLLFIYLSKNLYGLPASTFEIIYFFSSFSYWYLAGNLIKSEKDIVGKVTLLQAAEAYWFIVFYTVSALAIAAI